VYNASVLKANTETPDNPCFQYRRVPAFRNRVGGRPRTDRVRSICSRSIFHVPPATVAKGAQSATEGTRTPGFEYLGTLRAETGTRTVVENGPQGTRTIVQVVGGRFEGPRLKASVQTPAGDWITNRVDGSYRLDVRLTLKTDDGQ